VTEEVRWVAADDPVLRPLVEDLAREYATSAAWTRLVAHRTTDNVWAHDLTIVADAAFARFARGAQDYRDRDRG